MQQVCITVINEVGLHARPASVLVQQAKQFKAAIWIRNLAKDAKPVDAKSILRVLAQGIEKGHCVEIVAEGEDEATAIGKLKELIETDFRGML
jgi:phosphotransferase system HPr (HPr) family protein